jgi:hypothetical protein
LNPEPFEYEAGVLTTWPLYSIDTYTTEVLMEG